MIDTYNKFINESNNMSKDKDLHFILNNNISNYNKSFENSKKQFLDIDVAKNRAAHIKNKTLIDLPKYLVDFEAIFQSRGGKIIWAQDGNEAIKEVLKIIKLHKAKSIVKSKSMISEEISFNANMEKASIECTETNIGEYIMQIKGEKPSDIVAPDLHLSKDNIVSIFNEKFNLSPESTAEDIMLFTRELLREKFTNADIGVTGANFLVGDIGAVSITENEGNAMLSMSFPKIHIVITGIEKIIPKLRDLNLFLPLLSTYSSGQNFAAYNSLVFGPKREDEVDGPEEMYLILLDNGRSELLSHKNQRRSLTCIQCGACSYVCPIYKTIGGHAYGTTYQGPIGSVISPWMNGLKDFKHLSFASSLCGACTEVCPVKINLHELLLYNRNDAIKAGLSSGYEKKKIFVYKVLMGNRKYLDKLNTKHKNKILHKFFVKDWGVDRNLPVVASKSFKDIWEERKEGKKKK